MFTRAIEKGMVVISLHALHTFFIQTVHKLGMVMGASFKVQKDSPSISLMHHMLIRLWKHWFQSSYFLCCTRLFHGVCFHSCLSDNHLASQPSCFFGAKDRWLVNRLLVDMRKTTILLVKWTRRASLCPTTLTRRGMIGDGPIGSLLRSSPDGPGKRDGYVISQCIFLLPDFYNTDVDNLTLGTDNYQLFACFRVNKLNSLRTSFYGPVYFHKMMVSCIPSEKTSVGRFPSEREPAWKTSPVRPTVSPAGKDCRQAERQV